jgi:transcriptional regulator PpsR
MERDYAKLRDTEYRYRLLFHMSGEAVVIVDAATRRIVEANPAAERLIFGERAGAYGEPFARHFDPECQDDATALLSLVQAAASASANEVRLTCRGRELLASASLFREERTSQFLVRLVPMSAVPPAAPETSARLGRVLESMPDAFVLVDTSARIITANASFVEMVRLGAKEQVEGQPLNRFVGRSGLERDILIDNLRTHGMVRNFNTLLRTHLGDQEDVEISGVFTSEGAEPCFGLSIRPANRLASSRAPARPGVNRSVEQLTELVGRVPLKELVRESTDLVEKLCIEVALELTRNNRASAADILGLSRQGLYSKLHKFGLGNLSSDD